MKTDVQARMEELVPPSWRLKAKTPERIIFFGRVTIRMMVESWLQVVREIVGEIYLLDQRDRTVFFKATDDNLLLSLRDQRRQLVNQVEEINGKVHALLTLQGKAKEKPAMPDHRPPYWFRGGDTVICYLVREGKQKQEGDFAIATVKKAYPVVVVERKSLLFKNRVVVQQHYQVSQPEIMRPAEFRYLVSYPDFARIWAKYGTRIDFTSKFDPDRFLAALQVYSIQHLSL